MGIFNAFKSKNKSKQDQEKKDFGNDSLGDIAVELAEVGVISKPTDDNHNSFGEDISHLDENGELPFGWVYANKDFIEPRDKRLVELNVATRNCQSVKEEKLQIEKFINEFFAYKDECKKMGECYEKYFLDMHEKCHNSTNPCFSLVEPMQERLDFITKNYDELVANEELKEKILLNLDRELEKIIEETPGILQSELTKRFDPIVKSEVSSKLYEWDKNGKIIREKQGRSYKINLK